MRQYHKTRYGEWAGNPKGRKPDLSKCAAEVWRGYISGQCSKPCGHGPDQAFCKTHAKKYEARHD